MTKWMPAYSYTTADDIVHADGACKSFYLLHWRLGGLLLFNEVLFNFLSKRVIAIWRGFWFWLLNLVDRRHVISNRLLLRSFILYSFGTHTICSEGELIICNHLVAIEIWQRLRILLNSYHSFLAFSLIIILMTLLIELIKFIIVIEIMLLSAIRAIERIQLLPSWTLRIIF